MGLDTGSGAAAPGKTPPATGEDTRTPLPLLAASALPPPPPPLPPHAAGPRLSLERLPVMPHPAMLRTPSESSSNPGAATHALRDTEELIAAAIELPALKEEEMRRRVVGPALAGGEEALLRRLRFRFDRAGLQIPYERVVFRDLTASSAAAAGPSASVPTVGSALLGAARALVGRRRGAVVRALDGVDGLLRPGTMTLIVGPPGSGKTTLLKALTGRLRPDRHTRITGEVTHNGHPLGRLVGPRTSAYVAQTDHHLAALTVRETLGFAEVCLGPSAVSREMIGRLQEWEAANGVERTEEDEKAEALLAHLMAGRAHVMTEYEIEAFQLSGAADTLVGDAMTRGISGGERRRVTTAEMLVGPAQFFAMDEITNGLDAAVAYGIMSSLRRTATLLGSTLAASLLQPEPEVVALFDEVICLSEGRVIWQGPPDKVFAHFATLGLTPPPGMGVAEFLELAASPRDHETLRLGPAARAQKSEAGAPAPRGPSAAGGGPSFGGWGGQKSFLEGVGARRASRAASMMAPGALTPARMSDAFWESEAGRALQEEISGPSEVPPDLDHAARFTRPYGAPWHTLLRACLWRAATLELRRNWPAVVVRWLLGLAISLAAGSIFWRPPVTFAGGVAVMGMLFWVLCFVLVVTVPTVELTFERRPLMLRQRGDRFFPGWVEAVPQVLINLPIILGDVLVMAVPVYFMVGLAPDAGRLFTFLGILLVLTVAADNFYRLLGAVVPTFNIGLAIGVTVFISMELLAGFTISPGHIPQPWLTVHYLNPLSYAYRAAALNELSAPRWAAAPAPGGGPGSLGDALISFFEIQRTAPGGGSWVAMGGLALLGWVGVYVVGTMVAYCVLPPPAAPKAAAEAPMGPLEDGGAVALDVTELSPQNGANTGSATAAAKADPENSPDADSAVPPFVPVAVAFQDLHYYVPHPKKRGQELELLRGITGSFMPGRLVALMGSSGAGKTTLMDVIACRKTVGRTTGALSANGAPLRRRAFATASGYVEQTDVHEPLTTVGEALRFSAALRLPASFPRAAREALVMEVMRVVELDELEGALVGAPSGRPAGSGGGGLSTEQRKRLTIGVELVANPSVLFLDEPTTGLDSRAAAVVAGVMRAVASLGRTVVATIHQPSPGIFAVFDELMLLQRGGALVYSGDASGVVPYLSAFPSAPPIGADRNPASWMLEAVAAIASTAPSVSLAEAYAESPLAKAAAQRAADVAASRSSAKDGSGGGQGGEGSVGRVKRGRSASGGGGGGGVGTEHKPGVFVQLGALLHRNLRTYWRDPGHNINRYVICIAMAVVIGTVELGKGRAGALVDARAVQNGMGALYMLAISMAFEAAYEAQNGIIAGRPVFSRERASGTYGPGPYLLAQALAEVPWLLPQVLLFTAIVYPLLGLAPTAAGFLFALLVAAATAGAMFLLSQALVHAAPGAYLASLLLSVVGGSLFNVLCGFLAPLPLLPRWWSWFYYVNPMSYSLYALTADQFGGETRLVADPLSGVAAVPVNEYLRQVFGIQRAGPAAGGAFPGQWGAVGMLGVLCACYLTASYIGLRFLNHQKR